MQSDQPLTFQSIFSAIGQKLDSDTELRQLFSQALMLCLGGAAVTSQPPPEAPEQSDGAPDVPAGGLEIQEVEKAPDEVHAYEPIPATSPPLPPTSVDLSALVQAFKALPALSPSGNAGGRSGGPASLETIQARLKIKQDAIGQAMERAEAKLRGEEVSSTGQWFFNVISQAKALPNCYLWMCQARHESVGLEVWRQTATAFRVLGRALSLTEEIRKSGAGRNIFERSLLLLAEAQSALRNACMSFDFEDADQLDVYLHILSWSAAEQMYICRYMKADDLADPKQCHELLGRIDSLAQDFAKLTAGKKARSHLLGKIRYEAKMLSNNPTAIEGTWTKIITSVDQLISDGLPPSNADLRSILIGHLDDLPENLELPEGFKKFLKAVDFYLANQQPETTQVELIPTVDVQKVSSFLKGAEIVIIGGDCRHESKRALMCAFGLSDLNWIETRPHETTSQFEPAIARSDVKLVLLAIRWSSHSYGDVKKFCDRYDKKLVRLPRGYGVNQVAAEICNQCSEYFTCPNAMDDGTHR